MKDSDKAQQGKIPTGRMSRFTKLGSMASKIAGNMLSEGISELAKGNRPKVKDLLLTPSNMMRVADQLAQMRGAAMKLGQLISMDTSDLLSSELSDILARLRSDAESMPEAELIAVLSEAWGEQWRERFIQFSMQPIAAASIGQVHKAITKDLRRLAIKVQYPGIKKSINSDVDNVATLIKLSGLLPSKMDIKPLLKEAKLQLHDEANYTLEAQRIEQYAEVISGMDDFVLPKVDYEFSTDTVLAMTFLDGEHIETLQSYPQQTRNKVIERLLQLFFKELFAHQLMQTDPNFANYLYDPESEKIVLLDFGATRQFDVSLAQGYLLLMKGAYAQDIEQVAQGAMQIGLISSSLPESVNQQIISMCYQACEPLLSDHMYDFGASDLALRLREMGLQLGLEKTYSHTPPVDTLFLHRKLGGLFLLAIKLKAQVNVRQCFAPYQSLIIKD